MLGGKNKVLFLDFKFCFILDTKINLKYVLKQFKKNTNFSQYIDELLRMKHTQS